MSPFAIALSATLSVLLSSIGTVLAAEGQYPRPDLLVEPAQLARPAVARRYVVLDARSREDYKQEHVPYAYWVDHDEWAKEFGDGENAAEWGRRIGELGIDANSKVVVYDDAGMKDAARIWWILRYWGVDDVRLLNGGWKTWKAEGFPTTDNAVEPVAVEFNAVPRAKRLATTSQVLDLLADNKLQIVDARSEAEFCGMQKLSERAGAIPGAKNLEWSDLIDQETHRFKTAGELRRLFADAGIALDRPTASHCQSGGRASVVAFGLELMGAGDVRNYYRGWSEWGNLEHTPVAKPEN